MKDSVLVGFLWRKSGCLQPRISKKLYCKKQQANVDVVVGMMLFLILVLTLFFGFRISQYMITAAGVEDALAASNLASAVIDLEEYGKSHQICIADTDKAFLTFREALVCNLKLDEYLNTTNQNFLVGQVQIKEYRIYNVREEQVDIYIFNNQGEMISHSSGVKGEVYTPDNVGVETTTVYSRIAFQVEGLAGNILSGEKEKSIDIVRCDSE